MGGSGNTVSTTVRFTGLPRNLTKFELEVWVANIVANGPWQWSFI